MSGWALIFPCFQSHICCPVPQGDKIDVNDEVHNSEWARFFSFSAYYAAAPAAKAPETIESSILSNSEGYHSTGAAPAPIKEEQRIKPPK